MKAENGKDWNISIHEGKQFSIATETLGPRQPEAASSQDADPVPTLIIDWKT